MGLSIFFVFLHENISCGYSLVYIFVDLRKSPYFFVEKKQQQQQQETKKKTKKKKQQQQKRQQQKTTPKTPLYLELWIVVSEYIVWSGSLLFISIVSRLN